MSITPYTGCRNLELAEICTNALTIPATGFGGGWDVAGGNWLIPLADRAQTTTPGALTSNTCRPRPSVPCAAKASFSSTAAFTARITHAGYTLAFDTSARTMSFAGQTRDVSCGGSTHQADLRIVRTRNDAAEPVAVGIVYDYCSGTTNCIGVPGALPAAVAKPTFAVDACTAATLLSNLAITCDTATCYDCSAVCDTGYTITPPVSVTLAGATGTPGGCDCALLNQTFTGFAQYSDFGSPLKTCARWKSAPNTVTYCPGQTKNTYCTVWITKTDITVQVVETFLVFGSSANSTFKRTLATFRCYDLTALNGGIPFQFMAGVTCTTNPTCTILF